MHLDWFAIILIILLCAAALWALLGLRQIGEAWDAADAHRESARIAAEYEELLYQQQLVNKQTRR